MKAHHVKECQRLILYSLSYLMLLEWLDPILIVSDSSFRRHFVLFIGLSFVFYILRLPWKVSFPIKGMLALLGTVTMFVPHFSVDRAIQFIIEQWNVNEAFIRAQTYSQLTNEARTFLFFLLLWMMTYFVHYWLDYMKRMTLFVIVTLIFLFALHVTETLDLTMVIPKVLLYAVALLSVMHIYAMPLELQRSLSRQVKRRLAIAQVAMVTFVFLVAYSLPTLERDHPLPWQSSTDKKSGYSHNDTELGGDVADNDAVVMTIRGPKKQYWKLETKDTYTSKGWIDRQEEQFDVVHFPPAQRQSLRYDIQYHIPLPYIAHTYQVERIEAPLNPSFLYDEWKDAYTSFPTQQDESVSTFTVYVQDSLHREERLRTYTLADYETLPQAVVPYVQLPSTVPSRVYELAASVAAPYNNVYDQAVAIEQYFRLNGFVYDKQNIPMPAEDEDYVDQFLFDTKVGYCDNYSTSMVVMLRTLGIPARWAKGYTSGSLSFENGEPVYTVTQNDAHSWVEVYMLEEGWIPFEPTVSFSSPREVELLPSTEEELLEEREEERATPLPERERIEERANRSFLIPLVTFMSIIVLLLLLRVVRRPIPVERRALRQYDRLLKKIARRGYERELSETLRTFAHRVERELPLPHFEEAIVQYENIIYGKRVEPQEWLRFQQLVERLLQRIDG